MPAPRSRHPTQAAGEHIFKVVQYIIAVLCWLNADLTDIVRMETRVSG